MSGLVDYGSDSSDNEGVDDAPTTSKGTLIAKLPGPAQRANDVNAKRSSLDTDDVLEADVKRHDWEVNEAPQKPVKKKGPAKISLFGALNAADEASDDSDDEEMKKKRQAARLSGGMFNAAQPSSVKLFKMLPPASTGTTTRASTNPSAPKPTLFVPDSVKRAKVAKPAVPKAPIADYPDSDEESAPASKMRRKKSPVEAQAGSSAATAQDFFGLDKEDVVEPDMSVLKEDVQPSPFAATAAR